MTRIWHSRHLLTMLVRSQMETLYRGSVLGWAWSLALPLLLLAVYSVFFGFVFQARFGDVGEHGRVDYVLGLFSSLSVFYLFSESIGRAPTLVASNPSFVKKVVFPLELLPAASVALAISSCSSSSVSVG